MKKKNRHNILNDDSMISFIQGVALVVSYLLDHVPTGQMSIYDSHERMKLRDIWREIEKEVEKY